MNNKTNIAADAYRPEVLVFGPVEFVETHPRTGRIELQVECRCFNGFLLIPSQASKTVSECVRDKEVHIGTSSSVHSTAAHSRILSSRCEI